MEVVDLVGLHKHKFAEHVATDFVDVGRVSATALGAIRKSSRIAHMNGERVVGEDWVGMGTKLLSDKDRPHKALISIAYS